MAGGERAAGEPYQWLAALAGDRLVGHVEEGREGLTLLVHRVQECALQRDDARWIDELAVLDLIHPPGVVAAHAERADAVEVEGGQRPAVRADPVVVGGRAQ